MKVIALLLLLLRVVCKWHPLGGVPLFSWLLWGRRVRLQELGREKHWGSFEPHPCSGPGSLQSLTLCGPQTRKGDPGWNGV